MASVMPVSLSVISTVERVLEVCKKTKWSKRSKMQVEQIEALLKMITVSENRKIFDDFSAKMVGRIDDCLAPLKKLNIVNPQLSEPHWSNATNILFG